MKSVLAALIGSVLLFNPGAAAQPAPEAPAADLRRVANTIRSGTPAEVREAIESLKGLDGQLNALTNSLGWALKHPDPQIRKEAALRITALGSSAAYSVLSDLTRALKDPDPEVRASALVAVSIVRPASRAQVRDVLPCLRDKDPRVRTQAVIAVGRLGANWKDPVPRLVELLTDETVPYPPVTSDLTVAYYAAKSLGEIGPNAVAALPRLLELTKHKSRLMGWAAFEAAAKIGPTDPSVRKLLHDSLAGDDEARGRALDALPNLAKEDAREYYPALLKMLKGRDQPRLVSTVADLFSKVGEGKEVIDGLTELARDAEASSEARASAVGALMRLDLEPKVVIPLLADVVAGPGSIAFRCRLTETFIDLGPEAVPALIRLLDVKEREIRICVMLRLGRFGAAAEAALPALDKIAADKSDSFLATRAQSEARKIRAAIGAPGK
jgi:HEAT repeat protein